jgi:hypothetical protein
MSCCVTGSGVLIRISAARLVPQLVRYVSTTSSPAHILRRPGECRSEVACSIGEPSNMPHAEDSFEEEQARRDDELIAKALDPLQSDSFDFGVDRELEKGEKADDAIDYEDIDDDDLAEDEDELPKEEETTGPAQQDEVDDLFGDGFGGEDDGDTGHDALADDLDDLFGDAGSSPPPDTNGSKADAVLDDIAMAEDDEIFGEPIGEVQDGSSPLPPSTETALQGTTIRRRKGPDVPQEEEMSEMELLQRRLLQMANAPPAPPENQEELLASLWPKFETDKIPRFMDLLPPKQARYVGKTPLKVPKPVQPTKIHLDIAADQEKNFKFSAAGSKRTWHSMEEEGIVPVLEHEVVAQEEAEELDQDSDYEEEQVGGISWEDFQIICEDWDLEPLYDSLDVNEEGDLLAPREEYLLADSRPPKRPKLQQPGTNILDAPMFNMPSLHDPEQSTKRIARAVTLDLNDSHLLIDQNHSASDRPKRPNHSDTRRGDRTGMSKAMIGRYNISNDDAYELLKHNHQSRVRSTLGQPTITHSMPAVRLQYPYYKTKLGRGEARSFHRPTAGFKKGEPITFQKPFHVKKKHMKDKTVKQIFNKTEDLSLRDNSHVLLLEYSEEHPNIMTNFGMGSRVINYYRKKALDDQERPKASIGELSVLLPQDKSPFSIFGHIDPGQTTPAIYNGLYRAPIFEQQPKSTDFLMVRSGNSSGSKWYMRDIGYLRVVGQQFPSQEVPRPNGRKVSTAAKNRVKMIAYRLMRRSPVQKIGVFDVTEHVSDAIEILNRQKADMQSRQKMKEFLQYNKDAKLWGMPNDAPVPDEETTRSALPPEDACLVEAVQVGQQHLEDAGFTGQDDEEDAEDENGGKSIEQQLAPWLTTKNFLTACAGKAMLQLHGEGDPTRRGEAFSFLKTSMKGGFKALGESIEDKIDAKKLKENNGHSYNVAKQARAYDESIRRIWDAQINSLSATVEHSDDDMDIDDVEDRAGSTAPGATPRSEMAAPSLLRGKHDDETMSQFSKFSTDSQSGRVLRITRKFLDHNGNLEEREEIIKEPKVIRQYMKRRQALEVENIDIDAIKAGDVSSSSAVRDKLQSELERLERNKERRLAREKQKAGAAAVAASPASPNSPATGVGVGRGNTSGTQRKCANCGQVGHIKTNKKLCPMLNGTMKPQDSFGETAFSQGGSIS